jgi:signal transduction histidine kinase
MVEAEQMAAVGQLAATVAHEIGGPNTSIQVAVDHLIDGCGPQDAAKKKTLEQLLSQTERITRLTRQLISLADSGHSRLETVDLNEVAENACELMKRSFNERGVKCTSELDSDAVRALADRNQLLQALVNLLFNARTALQSWQGERRVNIRSESKGDRIHLHVEDSGPGIPPEDLSRIFLPYVSTTGGTGMGLYLTRQILVEQRGGIRVKSPNSMGGATFTVHLEKATDE